MIRSSEEDRVLVKQQKDVVPTVYDGGRMGVMMREMITAEDGAPTFAMRVFDIAAGATTPYHHHPWEHEVFIVKGQGLIKGPSGETRLTPGTAVFVPGNEVHQWINARNNEPFGFICVVPKGAEAESKPPC